MVVENIKSLQNKKLKLQLELNNLLYSQNKDQDKINELKSEILYLEKQIKKTIGKKEIQRREEYKRQGIDSINRKNYYGFKNKFKKISPIFVATNRMMNTIDNMIINEDIVKVKV